MGRKRYTVQVDRLTLECLLGRRLKDGYEVDHVDNNINNHKIVNLRELSSRDNKIKMQARITKEERTRRAKIQRVDYSERARKGWEKRNGSRR